MLCSSPLPLNKTSAALPHFSAPLFSSFFFCSSQVSLLLPLLTKHCQPCFSFILPSFHHFLCTPPNFPYLFVFLLCKSCFIFFLLFFPLLTSSFLLSHPSSICTYHFLFSSQQDICTLALILLVFSSFHHFSSTLVASFCFFNALLQFLVL